LPSAWIGFSLLRELYSHVDDCRLIDFLAYAVFVKAMTVAFRAARRGKIVGLLIMSLVFWVQIGKSADPEDESVQEADQEINRVYQQLARSYSETNRSSLKSMQRSWISFKERDFALFSHLTAQAEDHKRKNLYLSESITAQTEALKQLGATPPRRDEPPPVARTAREADQLLNGIYRECLTSLPPEHTQQFKEIQASWIKYRDLYCRFDAALKNGREEDFVLRDITANRVIQFRHYMIVLVGRQLPVAEHERDAASDLAPSPADLTSVPDVFRFAR
jgi:uncharacterized protein YecT (DUF1311 family)